MRWRESEDDEFALSALQVCLWTCTGGSCTLLAACFSRAARERVPWAYIALVVAGVASSLASQWLVFLSTRSPCRRWLARAARWACWGEAFVMSNWFMVHAAFLLLPVPALEPRGAYSQLALMLGMFSCFFLLCARLSGTVRQDGAPRVLQNPLHTGSARVPSDRFDMCIQNSSDSLSAAAYLAAHAAVLLFLAQGDVAA